MAHQDRPIYRGFNFRAGYCPLYLVVLSIRQIISAKVYLECHLSVFTALCGQRFSLYSYERIRKLLVNYTMSDISLEQSCRLYTFIIYTVIVGTLIVVGIIGNSLTFIVFWNGKFNKCSDFDYIRMDMSEQHANVRDSPSHTVTRC